MDVLLGTTNPSKAAMFENWLAGEGIRFLTLRDVSIPGEPEENGATPAENARRKAEYYGRYADYVICNDSGLYLAGLPMEDARQPGLHVRTPGGAAHRLDDDEMIAYYAGLAHSLGGWAQACYLLSERLRGENARKGVCLSGADGRSDARSFLVDGYALRGTAPRLAAGFPVLLQRPKNIFPFAQAAGTIRPRGRSGMETPSGVSERISGAFIPERIRSTHGISPYSGFI